MKELQRTKVGDFKIEQSINISQIKDDYIISIEEFFKDKEKIIFNENEMKKFLNGVKITINKPDGIYRIYNESLEFIGAGLILVGIFICFKLFCSLLVFTLIFS